MSAALTWLSIIAAIVAAGCWLVSALVPLPPKFTSGLGESGGSAQNVVNALRLQGRLSAAGAFSAAIAALAHAAIMWLSLP